MLTSIPGVAPQKENVWVPITVIPSEKSAPRPHGQGLVVATFERGAAPRGRATAFSPSSARTEDSRSLLKKDRSTGSRSFGGAKHARRAPHTRSVGRRPLAAAARRRRDDAKPVRKPVGPRTTKAGGATASMGCRDQPEKHQSRRKSTVQGPAGCARGRGNHRGPSHRSTAAARPECRRERSKSRRSSHPKKGCRRAARPRHFRWRPDDAAIRHEHPDGGHHLAVQRAIGTLVVAARRNQVRCSTRETARRLVEGYACLSDDTSLPEWEEGAESPVSDRESRALQAERNQRLSRQKRHHVQLPVSATAAATDAVATAGSSTPRSMRSPVSGKSTPSSSGHGHYGETEPEHASLSVPISVVLGDVSSRRVCAIVDWHGCSAASQTNPSFEAVKLNCGASLDASQASRVAGGGGMSRTDSGSDFSYSIVAPKNSAPPPVVQSIYTRARDSSAPPNGGFDLAGSASDAPLLDVLQTVQPSPLSVSAPEVLEGRQAVSKAAPCDMLPRPPRMVGTIEAVDTERRDLSDRIRSGSEVSPHSDATCVPILESRVSISDGGAFPHRCICRSLSDRSDGVPAESATEACTAPLDCCKVQYSLAVMDRECSTECERLGGRLESDSLAGHGQLSGDAPVVRDTGPAFAPLKREEREQLDSQHDKASGDAGRPVDLDVRTLHHVPSLSEGLPKPTFEGRDSCAIHAEGCAANDIRCRSSGGARQVATCDTHRGSTTAERSPGRAKSVSHGEAGACELSGDGLTAPDSSETNCCATPSQLPAAAIQCCIVGVRTPRSPTSEPIAPHQRTTSPVSSDSLGSIQPAMCGQFAPIPRPSQEPEESERVVFRTSVTVGDVEAARSGANTAPIGHDEKGVESSDGNVLPHCLSPGSDDEEHNEDITGVVSRDKTQMSSSGVHVVDGLPQVATRSRTVSPTPGVLLQPSSEPGPDNMPSRVLLAVPETEAGHRASTYSGGKHHDKKTDVAESPCADTQRVHSPSSRISQHGHSQVFPCTLQITGMVEAAVASPRAVANLRDSSTSFPTTLGSVSDIESDETSSWVSGSSDQTLAQGFARSVRDDSQLGRKRSVARTTIGVKANCEEAVETVLDEILDHIALATTTHPTDASWYDECCDVGISCSVKHSYEAPFSAHESTNGRRSTSEACGARSHAPSTPTSQGLCRASASGAATAHVSSQVPGMAHTAVVETASEQCGGIGDDAEQERPDSDRGSAVSSTGPAASASQHYECECSSVEWSALDAEGSTDSCSTLSSSLDFECHGPTLGACFEVSSEGGGRSICVPDAGARGCGRQPAERATRSSVVWKARKALDDEDSDIECTLSSYLDRSGRVPAPGPCTFATDETVSPSPAPPAFVGRPVAFTPHLRHEVGELCRRSHLAIDKAPSSSVARIRAPDSVQATSFETEVTACDGSPDDSRSRSEVPLMHLNFPSTPNAPSHGALSRSETKSATDSDDGRDDCDDQSRVGRLSWRPSPLYAERLCSKLLTFQSSVAASESRLWAWHLRNCASLATPVRCSCVGNGKLSQLSVTTTDADDAYLQQTTSSSEGGDSAELRLLERNMDVIRQLREELAELKGKDASEI